MILFGTLRTHCHTTGGGNDPDGPVAPVTLGDSARYHGVKRVATDATWIACFWVLSHMAAARHSARVGLQRIPESRDIDSLLDPVYIPVRGVTSGDRSTKWGSVLREVGLSATQIAVAISEHAWPAALLTILLVLRIRACIAARPSRYIKVRLGRRWSRSPGRIHGRAGNDAERVVACP
jgi:hypothetical protein